MTIWSRRALALILFASGLGWGLGGCGGGGKPASDGGRDAASDHASVPPGPDGGRSDVAVDGASGPDGASPPKQTYALTVTAVDTTFDTEDHFIAAVEMQLSGEPFAEAMGRDLGGYSRDYACQDAGCSPSMYADPASADGSSVIDLAGYSSAIESYEYSKQPMNNIAFESGAGTSLLFGPVLNPSGAKGTDALVLAQTWFEHIGSQSNAGGKYVQPVGATNPLGWPGLWPVLQPFASWSPAIAPTNQAGCSLSSDDNPGKNGALLSDDYECDYTTLNLPNREAQVTKKIGPGSSGWTDWKEALWTLNYLQIMHDDAEVAVDSVPDAQVGEVGIPGNIAQGSIHPGTYLGSSNIEGFQAGNFIQILDNQAAQWLLQLSTTDGQALGGFASLAAALDYSPSAPGRWFPTSIAVTEAADASGFPIPSQYTIASADSQLLDLAGLLGAYSSIYALTDLNNADTGGAQAAEVYFDGDPFPVQNQTPDGSPTLHDRALGMIRVAVVNMDRFHTDAATGIFVDTATYAAGGTLTPGTTLSSDVAAYTLLSLRTARRALDSELTLYGNTSPDTHGIPSPLDSFSPIDGLAFSARLDGLIDALANVFYDKLTAADGTAYAGWNVGTGMPTDGGTSLDAHSAAVRGLLVAYLATGQSKFRDRAAQVFSRLDATFYDPSARIYRPTAGDHSLQVIFTPRRFGILQGALRDTYELIGTGPGQAALAALIEDRVGRLNKLVLNGWDDRDQDQIIEWPSECAQMGTGPDGHPMALGALQMAERTLSGDTGSLDDFVPDGGTRVITTDREHDCVPEISAAKLPSALANSVTFTLTARTPAQ
jgi:hypothetical protein